MFGDDVFDFHVLDEMEQDRLARDARRHARIKPSAQVQEQARLFATSDGRQLNFVMKDFSKQGLGVLSEEDFLPDVEFSFRLGELEAVLHLVWGIASESEGRRVQRYGLVCVDPELDLEAKITSWDKAQQSSG